MKKWIEFVKEIAEKKKLKFNEALKVASPLYHKEKGTEPKLKRPKTDENKLTKKYILKVLKKKIDKGELYKGQSKKEMIEALLK